MSRSKRIRRCLAAGAATVLVVSGAPGQAQAAVTPALAMVLSNPNGPSGGGNSITGTVQASGNNPTPFAAGTLPIVQFQYVGTGVPTCGPAPKPVQQIAGGSTPATATTTAGGVLTVDPANVSRISGTKIAFVVPTAPYPATVDLAPSTINPDGLVLLTGQTSSKWNVCIYDSNPSTATSLLAATAYALAIRPKITAILPTASPAAGGQLITVNGVGFSVLANATTVSIGGIAVNNVRVAASGNSLTGITGPRAPAADLALVVSTTGGQVSSIDPDNNGLPPDSDDTTIDQAIMFTYRNGIAITPNTGPAGAKLSVDVRGNAFDALTFNRSDSATPTDPTAHVFLVRDAYDAATNRGVQECKNVRIVSATELICSLDLGADRLNPADSTPVAGVSVTEGTYTMTVVANGAASIDAATANPSVVSSAATFTVSLF